LVSRVQAKFEVAGVVAVVTAGGVGLGCGVVFGGTDGFGFEQLAAAKARTKTKTANERRARWIMP
jgi:hypothetical protein